ncbi:hypothetical protein [Streptomyces lydicus]|uniref:hypothetical protein n=1 Tax=Streptomyces lydicus TaxID=47763 RepID=UPI0037BB1B99
MTVFRVRPWFLPTSLAAFLIEAGPEAPADAPSDAVRDGSPGTPSDTRSAEAGPDGCPPSGDPGDTRDQPPPAPADRA